MIFRLKSKSTCSLPSFLLDSPPSPHNLTVMSWLRLVGMPSLVQKNWKVIGSWIIILLKRIPSLSYPPMPGMAWAMSDYSEHWKWRMKFELESWVDSFWLNRVKAKWSEWLITSPPCPHHRIGPRLIESVILYFLYSRVGISSVFIFIILYITIAYWIEYIPSTDWLWENNLDKSLKYFKSFYSAFLSFSKSITYALLKVFRLLRLGHIFL